MTWETQQEQSRENAREEPRQKTRRGRFWDWTGFGDKTAWDWMQLLIVPLVLAVGAFWFNLAQNAQQQETEELRAEAQIEAEDQRAQEERLQAYLEEMGALLIDEDLLDSEEDDEARYLARARTLALLRRADGSQKRSVVEFLAESGLAGSSAPGSEAEPVVSLANADLSGADLVLIDYLQGVDLTEANLSNTLLMRINLAEAGLRRANLNEANLSDTNLRQADLNEAELSSADLSGADLEGAHLSDANLEGVTGITAEELEEQAGSLESATMPDGTKHD